MCWSCFKAVCYSGCRANQAVYEVAQLRLRPGLNLDDVVNITNVSEGNKVKKNANKNHCLC